MVLATHTAIVGEIWQALVDSLGAGRPDELLLHAGLVIGDPSSLATLEGALPPVRRAVMLATARVIPPRPGFEEIAFRVIAEHDVPDVDDLYLAVWAGLAPREAGWELLSTEARALALTGLVRAGVPRSTELLTFAQRQVDLADKEALVLAWCAQRPFERSADEYRLIAELAPAPRCEAIALVLAQVVLNPLVARTWVLDVDAAWRFAKTEVDHAFADARLGALAAAAGATKEGEALVRHALGLVTRISDPACAADAYAVVLQASASIGLEPWLAAVETLTNDRRILRSRRAFCAARAVAVRTLARLALPAVERPAMPLQDLLARAHTALKEACRRVPERWLDLLLRTTMAASFARLEGRSIEVQLAEIGEWMRLDEPDPIPEITLAECVGQLVQATPDRFVGLTRLLGSGVKGLDRSRLRARWLAAALPPLVRT